MPLTRPEGIPIGQIGKVQSLNPRAEDSGLGTILRQAAAMEFTAGAQRVATGNQMVEFGAAQTAAGLELLKPFRKLRASRETLAADDIAIQAKLSLRASTDALHTSGATPDTWGESFQKEFSTVSQKALEAAGMVSPAAKEHVYKELQGEYLSLFTNLTVDAVKADGENQLEMLSRKESYELQEAIASRDSGKRKSHVQSYEDALDRAVFNNVLTPVKRQEKLDHFNKRLTEESVVQSSLENGLPETFAMIDRLSVLPSEKVALRIKAEGALKFKNDEITRLEKAQEKQLKLDQSAQYTTFRGKVLTESNPQNLLTLIYKIPEYIKSGVLGDTDGEKLIGDTERRLDELAKPVPETTVEAIKNDFLYRLAVDSASVTEQSIMKVRGLSTGDRTELLNMKMGRDHDQHYSKLITYKGVINRLRSIGKGSRSKLVMVLPGEETDDTLSSYIVEAVNTYEAEVLALSNTLKRRLTESDLATLDGRVKTLIQSLESRQYTTPAPDETLESLTR